MEKMIEYRQADEARWRRHDELVREARALRDASRPAGRARRRPFFGFIAFFPARIAREGRAS